MHVLGVIAEYNPFHNGHEYHIRLARDQSSCDYVVAVMSGSFTQRGEVTLLDKWTRARLALYGGVDAVFEMPAALSVKSAEGFAKCGIDMLNALGADSFSFGCETDDIALLNLFARIKDDEPDEVINNIKRNLNAGMSHPRARQDALERYVGIEAQSVRGPNAALAIEYLRANNNSAHPMKPYPILRTVGHNDTDIGVHASAGAIRGAILKNTHSDISRSVPPYTKDAIISHAPDGLADMHSIDELLLTTMRNMDRTVYHALPDMSEGLENRIRRMSGMAISREDLICKVKCKRYTYARISRACVHALLGITKNIADIYNREPYYRLLGFKRSAAPLLKMIADTAHIQIETNMARLKSNECFKIDISATDLQGLCTKRGRYRIQNRDFIERVVII
jgi:predicted nucleotidyltransferase